MKLICQSFIFATKMRLILALVLLAVSFASASAANFAKGTKAFQDGDFFTAWRILQKAAKRDNNITAKFYLGWMYENGKGVPKNLQEAVNWYLEAAQAGEVKAMNNLGSLYRDGVGVTHDAKQAVYWFGQAAEAGHPTAQVNLGLLYEQGSGVPRDFRRAFHWYHKAAQHGRVTGQFNLALMYHHGRGVAQNLSKAMHWYRQAAASNHAMAQLILARLLDTNLGGTQNRDEVLKFYRLAADHGIAEAQLRVAELLESGIGIPVHPSEIATHYIKAARSGLPAAAAAAGRLLEEGFDGLPPDPIAALKWHQKAAEAGEVIGEFYLAQRLHQGRGIPENLKKALALYQKAAAQGHLQAQMSAASLLERQAGFPNKGDFDQDWDWDRILTPVWQVPFTPNPEIMSEITALYERAAAQENIDAQIRLGFIYIAGLGMPVNPKRASEWLIVALPKVEFETAHNVAKLSAEYASLLDHAILIEAEKIMIELTAAYPIRADFQGTLGRIQLQLGKKKPRAGINGTGYFA